jgi:hypothetical protein
MAHVRLASAAAVVVALVLATVPGTATPAAAHPPRAAVRSGDDVVLLGDSVTEQAFGYLGGASVGAPAHLRLRRWSRTGWTLRAAADHAGRAVTSPSTGTLVLAVGPNDAAPWDHGWTSVDVARWRGVLERAPARACVAVVLPGWGAPLSGTPWARSLVRMRSDVAALVAARRAAGRPTITVDWLPVVRAHPSYLAGDGVHLAGVTAASARQALYWQAVSRCSSGGAAG